MQIGTTQKGFKLWKFKPRDSKDLNVKSNHSNGICSIGMQIGTIRTGFETFECKFEPLEQDVNQNWTIQTEF